MAMPLRLERGRPERALRTTDERVLNVALAGLRRLDRRRAKDFGEPLGGRRSCA